MLGSSLFTSPYTELDSITFSLNVKFIRPTSIVTVHSLTLQPAAAGDSLNGQADYATKLANEFVNIAPTVLTR